MALRLPKELHSQEQKGLRPEGTLENLTASECRRCKGQNPESLRQKDRALNILYAFYVCAQFYAVPTF